MQAELDQAELEFGAVLHSAIANAAGPGQEDFPMLLRRFADWIEQLGKIQVQDLTLDLEVTADGYWPSLVLYYSTVADKSGAIQPSSPVPLKADLHKTRDASRAEGEREMGYFTLLGRSQVDSADIPALLRLAAQVWERIDSPDIQDVVLHSQVHNGKRRPQLILYYTYPHDE